MQFNITFKTIFEYILKKVVLCIQIHFVSTEKTTRIASRASCSYNLRTRPLRLPFTRHVYAESCLKFQLVKVLNDTDKSVL